MANPIIIELSRGGHVESVHHGAFAVVDANGKIVASAGDIHRPIFPRSAIKAMQALFLVESGAANALEFGDKELALAASSHSAEPEHIDLAQAMLRRAGLSETDLECGSHWPDARRQLIDMARHKQTPQPLGNNCSGKHTGFLCAAKHLGMPTNGYVKIDHQVQREVAHILRSITEFELSDHACGIDGCSIPTYAIPLVNLAHGFAKMATGVGLEKHRADAATRLIKAAMAEPFFIAGSNRTCTQVMQAGENIFVKGGAEGVYCGALPEQGLGIALKIDDGAMRAAECAIPALIASCVGKDHPAFESLTAMANQAMRNCNQIHVGDMRATHALRFSV